MIVDYISTVILCFGVVFLSWCQLRQEKRNREIDIKFAAIIQHLIDNE
jgi:hypothetical protein